MIIYGDTNAKISHNRIKWNIMASTEVPTSETPGKIGDVIIVTTADVKKIKYVATKDMATEQLQDNSVNIYEDFTKQRVLVNESNGFKMYIQGTQQNIMLNGSIMIANVFFYDGLTGEWISYASAYKEALNVNSFTGQNLAAILDEIWSGPECTDEINEGSLLPTMVRQYPAETMIVADFTGSNLNVDACWGGPSLTGEALINNLIPA
jgi:hypothetical protein